MDLDAKVCLCFHVSRRKLLNFIRVEQPRVASQLSQCGGAGTGCGWCVPFLKQLFASAAAGETDLEGLSAEEYAKRRAEYVRAGKGTPPPGATRLPKEEREEGETSSI
jgi:bacterioferritin-associated ferredoxin